MLLRQSLCELTAGGAAWGSSWTTEASNCALLEGKSSFFYLSQCYGPQKDSTISWPDHSISNFYFISYIFIPLSPILWSMEALCFSLYVYVHTCLCLCVHPFRGIHDSICRRLLYFLFLFLVPCGRFNWLQLCRFNWLLLKLSAVQIAHLILIWQWRWGQCVPQSVVKPR